MAVTASLRAYLDAFSVSGLEAKVREMLEARKGNGAEEKPNMTAEELEARIIDLKPREDGSAGPAAMSIAVLERLVDEGRAAEPATLTIHTAIDFVTGSPEPGFARLADRTGQVFALVERRSRRELKSFRGVARAIAEARGAAKLVFGGLHPRLAEHAARNAAAGVVNVHAADYREVIRLPSGPLHAGEIEALLVCAGESLQRLEVRTPIRQDGDPDRARHRSCPAWSVRRLFRAGLQAELAHLQGDQARARSRHRQRERFRWLDRSQREAARSRSGPCSTPMPADRGATIWWRSTSAAFGTDDLVEVYQAAIAPTLLDFMGSAILASTPHGVAPTNFFYMACTQEEFGFLAGIFHAPSSKNPILPAEELERLRQVHHPLIFRQEFRGRICRSLAASVCSWSSRCCSPNGKPWDTPKGLDYVFAVIDSGVKGGVAHDASAVVYFGRDQRNQRLYVLDWEAVELGAASLEKWFFDVAVKLRTYRNIERITWRVGPVFVEPAGLGELLLAKFPGDTRAIDACHHAPRQGSPGLKRRADGQWRRGAD